MGFNTYADDVVKEWSDKEKKDFLECVGTDRLIRIVLGHYDYPWLHFQEVMDICDDLGIEHFKVDEDDEDE